jgi:hypothetical protein
MFRFFKQRTRPYRDNLSTMLGQILPCIGRIPCEIDLSSFKKTGKIFIWAAVIPSTASSQSTDVKFTVPMRSASTSVFT